MDLLYKDRRRSITTSTGTGNLTLTAGTGPWTAITDADFSPTDKLAYVVASVGGEEWETGIGYLDTGNVLVREQVKDSSTGSAVSFSAGDKEVFVSLIASRVDGLETTSANGVLLAGRAVTDTTTDATPTDIIPSLNNEFVAQTCVVELYVLAQTADFKTKSWKITYMLVSDGMTYTMYGKTIATPIQSESLAWDVDVTTDGNHIVTVTGAAATTINWYVFGSVKAAVPTE